MKFSQLLTLSLLGATAFASSDEELNVADAAKLDKRAFLAVTGATNNAAPRLEIRQLAKNADQWNLYILAMQRFMAMPYTDKMSYYQISGVHGRPFVQWNDVAGIRANGGYCPHVSNMFLPWHRPYLALFEQQLLVCAQQVVNSFPAGTSRTRYQNALNTLRMPYWDSAQAPPSGECSVPTLIRDQRVTVTTPSGVQTINNPLYSYQFQQASLAALGGSPFNYWTQTWRRPVLPAQTARSNNNVFCSLTDQNRISLRDRTYNLFARTTLYRLFSTEATGAGTGNTESHDSVESVHDAIHIIAGGETGGHMYYLDYSGFDPVFWLHHTNIDRLGAMFQVINPNTYVEPGTQTQDNYQWSRGQVKNWYTPLKPFTSDTAGNFWVPQTVRDTNTFRYYYPETGPGASANSVRAAVNSLYGPNSSSRKRDFRLATRAENYEGHPVVEGDHDYTVHITSDKFSVGGSYSIQFWLGNAGNSTGYGNSTIGYSNSTSATNSTSSYQYVGLTGILAPYQKMDQQTYVSGNVPLTTCLQGKIASGELANLDPETVGAYLEKNLHWEIVKAGGETIPASDVGGLDIAVSSQKVLSSGSSDTFPSYSPKTFHPEITKNKPGGSTSSDGGQTCEPVVEYQYVDENGAFLYTSMEAP